MIHPWPALAWWVIDRVLPGLLVSIVLGGFALVRLQVAQRRADERHADLKAHVTATVTAAVAVAQQSPRPETEPSLPLFTHEPHPRVAQRRLEPPPKVADQHQRGSGPLARFNARAGLGITIAVGTMWAAYLFCVIALISLPSALKSGNLTVIIAWLSSNFLQLVLLPVIIVGQNAQARAADKRAEQTYQDAESILHECLQLQAHLKAQDDVLEEAIRAQRQRREGAP